MQVDLQIKLRNVRFGHLKIEGQISSKWFPIGIWHRLRRDLFASGENEDPHFMLDAVATEDLELIQLDVKTTFLHGDLKEEFIWNN